MTYLESIHNLLSNIIPINYSILFAASLQEPEINGQFESTIIDIETGEFGIGYSINEEYIGSNQYYKLLVSFFIGI